ncbi:MAG: membrane dipeptidase [Coriobacteriia bacterium]|nr:membrane dipeptidase [Coriobacteriia bacterium]
MYRRGSGENALPIIDLHCDTLVNLIDPANPSDFEFIGFNQQTELYAASGVSLADNNVHLSLSRMQPFDWCQCMAIFISDRFIGETAWNFYRQVKRFFDEQLIVHYDQVTQAHEPADIWRAFAQNKSAAMLTIEGGSFLQNSLTHIDDIAADGVKMLTLTWNRQNAIASGVSATGGLSNFGREVVKTLEEHRIIVDVSHLNDQSFADVNAAATRPYLASHSNSRAICDHPRNLTDNQFKALCANGGIVGLNYYTDFLVAEKRPVTPTDILRHLDHWLELGGEKHVALGSDFDGADMPEWLSSCDKVAVLYDHVATEFGRQIAGNLFFWNAYRFFSQQEIIG